MRSNIISLATCFLFIVSFIPAAYSIPLNTPHWLSKAPWFPYKPSPPSHHGRCTKKNMEVRKEWSALSKPERLDFINSVKCLMKKNSKIPKGLAPGAISRYDDFVAEHVNKTRFVHGSGIFLTYHRNFIHLFQQSLREECGYKGTIPYWNWPWWAENLQASPLFDNSKTSLSGDGDWDPNAAPPISGNLTLPRGTGGGCVSKGPFANTVSNFQAVPMEQWFLTVLPPGALDHKPHCLRRDINNGIAKHNTNQKIVNELLASRTIKEFQQKMDAWTPNTPDLGPHVGGHWSLGEGLRDVFTSPSDPAFYLHHGMVDLMYTLWQSKDPARRKYALSGGDTTLNNPPSPDVGLDYTLNWGFLGRERKIKEVMDVTDGPFCYRYEYVERAPKPRWT